MRYPFAAATRASPSPVLPAVASIIVPPGASWPSRSAASTNLERFEGAGGNIDLRVTSGKRTDGRGLETELLRQFRCNRRGGGAGINGELEWSVAICMHVHLQERLRQTRQPHRDLGLG